MSFSQMSSKEKTIVGILAVVIVVALCGIGFLGYQLLTKGDGGDTGISMDQGNPTAVAPAVESTVTLIPPPSLDNLGEPAAGPTGSEPVAVARQQSVGPLAPVIVASHPLRGGHNYRVEIATANGSRAAFNGQWSQSATSASGKVAAPQIEFIEGFTPHTFNVAAPVPDPTIWGISVSAGPKIGGATSPLVITIWDVTGTQ